MSRRPPPRQHTVVGIKRVMPTPRSFTAWTTAVAFATNFSPSTAMIQSRRLQSTCGSTAGATTLAASKPGSGGVTCAIRSGGVPPQVLQRVICQVLLYTVGAEGGLFLDPALIECSWFRSSTDREAHASPCSSSHRFLQRKGASQGHPGDFDMVPLVAPHVICQSWPFGRFPYWTGRPSRVEPRLNTYLTGIPLPRGAPTSWGWSTKSCRETS